MTPIILTLVAAVSAVAALLGCWLVDRQRYGKTRAKLVKQGEELLQLRRWMRERLRKRLFYRKVHSSQTAFKLIECRKQLAECRKAKEGLDAAMETIYRVADEIIGHNLDRPIEVGDSDKDPIHLEISLCGPKHVAVYVEIARDAESTDEVKIAPRQTLPDSLCIYHGKDKVLLMCHDGVGFGNASDVEKIIDAVRRYNENYHASKGVEDAGAATEAERTDPDRGRNLDHGGEDPRRQGTARSDCPERCACRSS